MIEKAYLQANQVTLAASSTTTILDSVNTIKCIFRYYYWNILLWI